MFCFAGGLLKHVHRLTGKIQKRLKMKDRKSLRAGSLRRQEGGI